MIHSARPTIPPVAITIFSIENVLLCAILKSRDVRTEVQTPRAKIVITIGRDCGSAEWINSKSNYGAINFQFLLSTPLALA